MKKIFLIVIVILSFFKVSAQNNISVKSFRPLVGDMTTTSAEGKRIDQNNEVCALIKIVTTEKDFAFEGGALGIVGSQQRKGEIWVWVPRGLRKITILHDQLGVLRDYRFPVEIEADRTYELVLTTAKIETIVKEEVREQFLVFQITPPDAMLEVNDQIWPVSAEGTARKMVDFGTYSYRVQAQNYHPDAGRVTVDDPDNTQKVVVTLRPNFGWIEVRGGGVTQGAAVYIDNTLAGKVPFKSEALKSGQHTVRIVREMYEPYSTTVTVNDNETTMVTPNLTADFANVTLRVDADAEIWVNGERKGVRTWTGDLANGTYKMECKLENHESSMVKKEITSQMNGEVIQLEAPRPINGSLVVESNPDMATLYIDGKAMGETPKLIKEILVGRHEIKLTKKGCADYTETITITKGERKQVTATLSNGKEIQFTCNVPNAQLEIDGQRMNSANGTYMLTYGQHNLKAIAADYRDYTYTFNVSESGSCSHSIQMKAISRVPEGALQGTFSVSASKKVYFAKGNLQYQASTKSWRFAEHQYDHVGKANENISPTYDGWIDLFGWGTGSNPTNSSTSYFAYSSFTDWGSRIGGGWRTLTKEEWKYVFDERKTTSGIRYAKATVNYNYGVILLPDSWDRSCYKLKKTNKHNAAYSSNVLSATQWTALEDAGAVFLPAAGTRSYGKYSGVGGDYWSASYIDALNTDYAYHVGFGDGYLFAVCQEFRSEGQSVRLVAPAE